MSDAIDKRVANWVRPEIRALSAYHVPDPGKCIKLDAMENPYGWPPEQVREWLEILRTTPLNRYPDPSAATLAEALRTAFALPEDMGLLLGNGSDELIQMIALAVAGPERLILAPEPTFVMYRMIAVFAGMRYVGVPLSENEFELDIQAMLAAIDQHQPAVVFLAMPNNPTGNLFDAAAVREILQRAPGLVVVDEAYAPFTDATFKDELGKYDNLLLLRTVSKMGLAGLRLGFLVGPRPWLDEIDKVRLPYNVNVLTQASARFALQHAALLQEQAQRIREDRTGLLAALARVPGVTAYPSEANFILFRTPNGVAKAWFAALKARGILIKNLDGSQPALRDCLRVTVGTPDENAAFIAALTAIAAGG